MSLKKWKFIGFVFVSVLGVLFHFAYKLFETGSIWGYFVPVSESIWEHLKLIFWPGVLFMIPEYICFGKNISGFFAVGVCSMFASMLFIVAAFYTYSGILGFSLVPVDIFLFFGGVGVYKLIEYYLTASGDTGDLSDDLRGISVLILLGLCFVFWTYNPPYLGIFWG